jgi:hypothetical protein
VCGVSIRGRPEGEDRMLVAGVGVLGCFCVCWGPVVHVLQEGCGSEEGEDDAMVSIIVLRATIDTQNLGQILNGDFWKAARVVNSVIWDAPVLIAYRRDRSMQQGCFVVQE